MSPDSSTGIRLAALYAATFVGLGVQLPFLPVWLAGRGLGPGEIGIVLAVPMVVRLVLSSSLAGLADGRTGAVRVLVGAQLIVAASQALLPLAPGFASIGVLVALAAAGQAPIMPLCDVLTIAAGKRFPRLHYGRIRLWGSIAYLAANLGAGVLIGALGPHVVAPAMAISALLAAGVAALAPEATKPHRHTAPTGGKRVPKVLLLVIAGAALVQASHGMIYAFGSLSFEAAGYSASASGALWATGVLAEIIVFGLFGGAVGTGFPVFSFLALGASSAALRWVAMAADPAGWLLVLLMAAHGVSFGATHLGTVASFALYAPDGARARSQGLFVSASALATGTATAVSGPLYRGFGTAGFLGMVPLAVAGLLALLLAARLARPVPPQPQRAEEGGRTTLPS